ncbi:hypothetical protein V6N13_000985 [Hibiscus sabdariffa]
MKTIFEVVKYKSTKGEKIAGFLDNDLEGSDPWHLAGKVSESGKQHQMAMSKGVEGGAWPTTPPDNVSLLPLQATP